MRHNTVAVPTETTTISCEESGSLDPLVTSSNRLRSLSLRMGFWMRTARRALMLEDDEGLEARRGGREDLRGRLHDRER